jgi:hypothetical protein
MSCRISAGGSCLLLFLILTGCTNSQRAGTDTVSTSSPTKRVASENVVRVEAQPVELIAGATTEASVRLKVEDGYHINANPATFPYLIATQLDVPKADGISAAGVSYPPPLKKNFSFGEDLLAVYEGEAELKVVLLADKGAKHGQTSIPAKLRIQACDDQVCYPPGTIDVWIPITVK